MSDALRELNAPSLFQLLVRRWHLILLVPVLTVGAAAAAWHSTPDSYQSRAELLIQSQQTMNPSLRELLRDFSAAKRLPLIESIFLSDATSERVLRELGALDEHATSEEVVLAVADFQRQIEVIGLGSDLVLVKMVGSTPMQARDSLSLLIEVFTEQILKPQEETVRLSTEYLESELARLRETSMQATPGDAAPPEPVQAEVLRRGGSSTYEIRQALVDAEVRLATLEDEIEQAESNMRRSDPNTRQMKRDLYEAQSKLSRLQSQYIEGHPDLAIAQERVRGLREAIQARGAGDAGSGRRSPAAEARVRKLAVAAEAARAEVGLLKQRLLNEELSMYEASNQIWTVQPPTMPTKPLKPGLLIVLITSLVAGLILTLVWLALSAATDDSLRGQKELAEALHAPALGSMPLGDR